MSATPQEGRHCHKQDPESERTRNRSVARMLRGGLQRISQEAVACNAHPWPCDGLYDFVHCSICSWRYDSIWVADQVPRAIVQRRLTIIRLMRITRLWMVCQRAAKSFFFCGLRSSLRFIMAFYADRHNNLRPWITRRPVDRTEADRVGITGALLHRSNTLQPCRAASTRLFRRPGPARAVSDCRYVRRGRPGG